MKDPTPKEVWDTLSAIDVSDHVELKNGLRYLSWMWAWTYLMQHFPQAYIRWKEDERGYFDGVCHHADGSATVGVSIVIGLNVTQSMWLPVMDHRNKAIQNPDARAISDSKMRCLVKCMGMLGLGSYLYAGEDLPLDPKRDQQVKQQIENAQLVSRQYVDAGGVPDAELKALVKGAIQSRNPDRLEKAITTVSKKLAELKEKNDDE